MAKEFIFKGKTMRELNEMDVKEFARLLPARQRRSLTRGMTEEQKKLVEKIKKAKAGQRKKPIKTHVRDIVVLPIMIGAKLQVYNGKEYKQVELLEQALGHYLGEFSLTRKKTEHSAPGVGATRSSAATSAK